MNTFAALGWGARVGSPRVPPAALGLPPSFQSLGIEIADRQLLLHAFPTSLAALQRMQKEYLPAASQSVICRASRLAHAARTMRCRLNFAVIILNLRAASDPVKYAEVVLTSTRSMKYVCGGPKEKRGLSPRHNLRAIYRRCWSS